MQSNKKINYQTLEWYFGHPLEIPNDWVVEKFAKLITDGPSSGLYSHEENYGSGDKIVGLADVFKGDVLDTKQMKKVNLPKNERTRYILKSGDLIFSRYSLTFAGVGKCLYIPEINETILFESNTLRVSINKKMANSRYLSYYFNDGIGRQSIIRILKQVSATGITGSDLKSIKIILPKNIQEQQKISSILSNMDVLIQSVQKQINQTHQLRNGLTQQLLTRGIKHTKFEKTKLGEFPKEWELDQIKNIVKNDKKVTYGIVQPGKFDPSGILLIRGKDYINGWVDEDQFFKVDPKLHKSYIRAKTIAGDILLCIAGANIGAVNQVPNWIKEANITQTTARISCDEDKMNPKFVLYFLDSYIGRKQSSRLSKGSAQPGLNLDTVENFYIPRPHLFEQNKIASILSNILFQIEKQMEYKTKLEILKKGLVQKLLIGQIRVKT